MGNAGDAISRSRPAGCSGNLPGFQYTLFLIIGAELGAAFLRWPQTISLGGLLLLQHVHEMLLIICVAFSDYISTRWAKLQPV